MAANKDKLLESAQKSLKKKQISRAIKDYTKVVEIDPADVRARQKLAELLVKTNRNADAYEHFEAVAKYFSSNGFYLKAIAIYKQMQRLDSTQVSLFSRLAELNEKQGLIGNAMAEYRNLVNYYERNGMVADSIKVLEKMRDLDAANLNVRVKLAEVYATNDRGDDGLVEFEGVLSSLTGKGDFDKILKLYKMFMPLFPDNQKLKMGLALTLYEKGELQKGIAILSGLLQDKPEDPDLLRLLARGYDDLKDWEKSGRTYQQLLQLDPSDLDTREQFISSLISSQQYPQALDELEEWKDSFFKSNRVEQLKTSYEILKDELPDNPIVLQTLDSIYELTGDGEKLLDIMSVKEESSDSILEETLSDSILASAEEDIELPSIDLELPLDEEDEVLEMPEEDFDLQLDAIDDDTADELDEDSEAQESVIELDIKDSDELVDDGEIDFSFDIQEDEEPVVPATSAESRDVGSDLEEAEFYVQQGLYAEAEKLCLDILAYAPDSEECRQKLDVIRSQLNSTDEQAAAAAEETMSATFADIEDSELDVLSDSVAASSEKKVFRTDVDEQIAADDMESHYNLGIAYREMGLVDDAISEFEKAEKDPSRYVDCQTLKGLCFAAKGDFVNAEQMYQQALDSRHLEEEQRLNLNFELATLYETSERFEEALGSYRLVRDQDESYRDVAEKVANLQQILGIEDDAEPASKERISFL